MVSALVKLGPLAEGIMSTASAEWPATVSRTASTRAFTSVA